ncbi:MAG: hypothetical protein MK078_00015 [Crocinitomicaceae bacterium]|nr:hypothetical protein [Crocinitomicaceae bacterium]
MIKNLLLALILWGNLSQVYAQDNFSFEVLEASDTIIDNTKNIKVKITFSTVDGAIHYPEILVYNKKKEKQVYTTGLMSYVHVLDMSYSFFIPKRLFKLKKYRVKLKCALNTSSSKRIQATYEFEFKQLHKSIKSLLKG